MSDHILPYLPHPSHVSSSNYFYWINMPPQLLQHSPFQFEMPDVKSVERSIEENQNETLNELRSKEKELEEKIKELTKENQELKKSLRPKRRYSKRRSL